MAALPRQGQYRHRSAAVVRPTNRRCLWCPDRGACRCGCGRGIARASGPALRRSGRGRPRFRAFRAVAERIVKVLVDENLSPALAKALDALFDGEHEIVHLRERFGSAVTDLVWIETLSNDGRWAVIS